MKEHRCTLVRDADRWEVLESTEARNVEETLRKTEERLRSLSDSMSEGFAYHRILLDGIGTPCDYVFLEVNRAFEQLTGLQSQQVIGRRATEVLPGIEKDSADWIGRYGAVATTGRPARFESQSQILGRWFAVSAFSPHPGYFATTFSDITDLKRAAAEREQLLAELQARNRDLDDFAYVISHDLKAPLRAISGLSSLIEADLGPGMSAGGSEQLALLRGRVRRMHELIEGVLQYSRAGRTEAQRIEVDTRKIVLQAVELLAPPARFDVVVAADLPVHRCDPVRVGQVFQNLIDNAVKYMDKPRAEIRVGCQRQGGVCACFVADNGPGIDRRYHERIFKLFQTLAPKDDNDSTGIGLAIVKRLVESWNGRIWVESEPGQGSTFWFTLP